MILNINILIELDLLRVKLKTRGQVVNGRDFGHEIHF